MTIATVCYLKTTSTTNYNCKNFVHLNKTPIIWILTSTILIIFLLNLYFHCTKYEAKRLYVKRNVFVQRNIYYDVTLWYNAPSDDVFRDVWTVVLPKCLEQVKFPRDHSHITLYNTLRDHSHQAKVIKITEKNDEHQRKVSFSLSLGVTGPLRLKQCDQHVYYIIEIPKCVNLFFFHIINKIC